MESQRESPRIDLRRAIPRLLASRLHFSLISGYDAKQTALLHPARPMGSMPPCASGRTRPRFETAFGLEDNSLGDVISHG